MKNRLTIPGLCALFVCMLLSACNLSDGVESQNDFPDTMTKVQQELTNKGYKVTRIQALDQGLEKAGYTIDRYRIIFFGNPLDFDIVQQRYPQFSVFLPLSITVYEKDDKTYLQAMPFSMLVKVAHDREYLAMVSRWRSDVDEVLLQATEAVP
jgi:uncharacterized protein (DUF302 family)